METIVEAIIIDNSNVLLSKDSLTLKIWDLRADLHKTEKEILFHFSQTNGPISIKGVNHIIIFSIRFR